MMAKDTDVPKAVDVKNMELLLAGVDAHVEAVTIGEVIRVRPAERREPIWLDGELCYLVAGPPGGRSGTKHGDKRKRGCGK